MSAQIDWDFAADDDAKAEIAAAVRHLLKEHAIDLHSHFLSEGGAFCKIAGPNALAAADAATLAERIPPGRVVSMHEQMYSLWDTYAALGAIVLLLTAEWILRKKHNMT